MRLLLLNGNTTQAVTDAVCAHARTIASHGTIVEGATARFGAAIVTSPAGHVVAGHAVLDRLAELHGSYDAAILAISFDSGLMGAREIVPVPVIGMTEAALMAAGSLSAQMSAIVFGASTVELYRSVFASHGFGNRVCDVRCIDLPPTAYLSGEGRDGLIVEAIRSLPADRPVVICGAALAGTAARLQPLVPQRLVCGITEAVRQAEVAVANARPVAHPAPIPSVGLSPALTRLFAGEA